MLFKPAIPLAREIMIPLLVLTFGWVVSAKGQSNAATPKYEFRAVWVATVVNIDWPSTKELTTGEQKQEFIELLDFYQELNFNAVIVQIRAAGDAFYASAYEPWSKYLTGEEGRPPEPYYDPLEWMIAEAHERGYEFHAWFNPYRATFDKDTLALAPNHAFNTHRDWMVEYGKRFYFNPGLPAVRRYTTNVIMEVVNKYDIDGVHFDDYFYPYKVKEQVFADSLTYALHGIGKDIESWRRASVDSLVKNVSDSIRAVKPWVQFGISPFGVWRNASVDSLGSNTRAGQTTFDDLYADPLKWMEYQWIDNVIPQLYWSMDYPPASHRILVQWWSEREYEGHLYVGNGAYKVKNNSDKAWRKYREIIDQVDLARNEKAVTGNVFFSAKSIRGRHERLARKLKKKKYRYPALPPPSPFAGKVDLEKPVLMDWGWDSEGIKVTLHKAPGQSPRFAWVYGIKSDNGLDTRDPSAVLLKKYIGEEQEFAVSLHKKRLRRVDHLVFTFIDKYGHESDPLFLALEKSKEETVK